ncbi:phosphoribosyltransferase [Deinococcus kurensis]|uniref:phosphoribosyltransferase n=1 Tax=Deinococcus kurensis TaxID=2662757 RepID=UPI0012D30F04|nr:phosphoribosyltransferase [Deinococcus kurensis]
MNNHKLKQKLDFRVESLISTQNIIIQKYNYVGWLNNFPSELKSLAYRLLYSFTYISEAMTDSMLINTIQNLSCDLHNPSSLSEWKDFINGVAFAPVRTNGLNFSDSGNLFVGKVKKLLQLDEECIIGNLDEIVNLICDGKKVILVDDFVGTGDQFDQFILMLKESNGSYKKSCLENLIYAPLLSTARGYKNITSMHTQVKFSPLHIISEDYSVLGENSIFWRGLTKEGRAEKITQIVEISKQLRVEDSLIFGYKDLGLGLSFQHGAPDATLPIFTHSAGNWVPLVGG